AEALSARAGARLRRQSEPRHRSRRLDRLPADAGHAGGFQALRRQGQHPVSMMDPTYKAVSEFAQTWGLVYFVVIFALVLLYALWPSHKARFGHDAHIPLRED